MLGTCANDPLFSWDAGVRHLAFSHSENQLSLRSLQSNALFILVGFLRKVSLLQRDVRNPYCGVFEICIANR